MCMHRSACLIYDLRKFEQRGNGDRYTATAAAAAAALQIDLKDYATMRGGYATTGVRTPGHGTLWEPPVFIVDCISPM